MIQVIAVGKKFDAQLAEAIKDYEKRLRAPFDIDWLLLPYSHIDGQGARDDESQRILAKINPSDRVVLLDERGRQFTSERFSELIIDSQQQLAGGGRLVVVIGGAYGVNDELMARANTTLSLSKMVFPHQLVRLILVEQIYRAQAIHTSHPYHHV